MAGPAPPSSAICLTQQGGRVPRAGPVGECALIGVTGLLSGPSREQGDSPRGPLATHQLQTRTRAAPEPERPVGARGAGLTAR